MFDEFSVGERGLLGPKTPVRVDLIVRMRVVRSLLVNNPLEEEEKDDDERIAVITCSFKSHATYVLISGINVSLWGRCRGQIDLLYVFAHFASDAVRMALVR